MKKSICLKAAILSAPLLLSSAFATEQPAAEDLVGKVYGGLHLLHINTDNDRLMTADPRSNVDHGSGFGGEFGYRLTESAEIRLSYSKINLVKENAGFSEPDASSIAADVLYFPTKKNFYVLGGLDSLDIVDRKTSLDLGAGYRHYFSERAAVYFEGKGHIADKFSDASAKIGFVYFFGDSAKSRPAKAKSTQPRTVEQTAAVAPVVAAKDSDKDGVLDKNDNCMNTPMADKVDHNGCTVFSDEKVRMQLLVNFDNNKAEVKPEYFAEIKKMAEFLTTYPHTSLVIEGHTSKVGSAAYNKKISQKRANAIVNVLVDEFSIDASRLSAVGYGEERLLSDANDAATHAKNRRIEAKIEITKQVALKR